MIRRRLLPLVIATLGIVRAADVPNVLLILSDDQSVPHVGCYGNRDIHTPNLDRLAADGMRFDRAYVTAPQCAPSRKSLLSGRSPVGIQQTTFTLPLQREVILFPEILRSKGGYFTGLAGRSHHLDGAKQPALRELYESRHLQTAADRVDYARISTGKNGLEVGKGALQQFREFLGLVPAGKPFFLQLCFSDPHRPFDGKEIPDPHDPKSLVLPAHVPDTPALRRDLASYYDEINRMDGQVGEVLAELERRELADHTIVLFMGDNGASQLRGKGTLYEWGVNVPLIVRWPGVAKPGSSSKALVSGEDLAPTLLQACGQEPLPEMTGVSFLGALKGTEFKKREFVVAERGPHVGLPNSSTAFDLSRTIIGPRYKLIYNATWRNPYAPVDFAKGPAWRSLVALNEAGSLPTELKEAYFPERRPMFELYDLHEDPSELRNLAGSEGTREIEKRLRHQLTEWMVIERDHLPLPQ